ncbi:major facilitator superfamily domain-containing protein [Neurospora tetraspora]|uniref:Major facilitator superfamily domain-containing protein n=1 Tax=Neurospora tetraspora TaxID=94610 RepID=A0AAE0J777_9PEZI|nr:major facilitator superfamily domain-containing protein [Neurospora tetraspora]
MLDTTIVATSLYEIGREFDKLDAVNWVALAYTLAFVGCAILFAKVSDVVGRKRAFTAAYVLFVAFSIGCAGANTFTQLLICRAFQGVGGSGLYSLAIIILTEVTPPRWKRFIGTIIGVIIAFAGVLGPILGGVLTNYLSWRWIFWINISGIVAGIVFLFAWPHPEYLPAYQRRSLWQSDVLGSLLLTGAAVLITWAFQNVRAGSGWNDHLFIAPFASGFFCLILLAVWTVIVDNTNLRNRMTTVIPVVLLKNHVYVLMAVSTACLGFGYLMTLYVFPMRFRVVNGYSALEASAMLLPMLGFSALGSMVAPRLSQKRNVLHWTIAAGGMLMTLGTALSAANATSSHRFGTTLYAVYVSLVGLGFGLNAAASTTLSIVESPVYEHATAQGLVALLRIWGGSIGIAVSGAALGTQGTSDIPLSLDLSLEHYTKALETSMIVACAITALGTICAFCARRSRQLSIAYMMQKREEDEAGRQAELAERREAERRKKQQARTDQPQ